MSKPPTAALNEVLLRAALRAERINHDRLLDGDASQQARRNDNSAILYRHRVPAASPENAHGRTPKSMDRRGRFNLDERSFMPIVETLAEFIR